MEQEHNSNAVQSSETLLSYFNEKRTYFDNGSTLSYEFRKSMLLKLKDEIINRESEICTALKSDLRKSETESFLTEIGVVLSEMDKTLKDLKLWMKPKRRFTPLVLEPSKSEIRYEPKGVVLIIAPWNYPFNLVFDPLIGAIAAGNCIIIKPSEEAPATASITESIIRNVFKPEYISVVQGAGSEIVPRLLTNHIFNHIFFTGSPAVGKIIAKQASENLVSTTLELGGKSPVIVDSSANLKVAAQRIVWGKFTNAGQTCVAPDYLLAEEKIREKLIYLIKISIQDFYGKNPQESPDYPRMINTKRYDAVTALMADGRIIHGGKADQADLYIEPTLLEDVSIESDLMQNEIFGPLLPVLSFSNNAQMLEILRKNRYPLACYYFGKDKERSNLIMERFSFGGGCINNCIVHLGNHDLPFGGVQGSGSGHYHGWHSFECFSNAKSILISKTWIDPSIKYPPYTPFKLKWLKRLF